MSSVELAQKFDYSGMDAEARSQLICIAESINNHRAIIAGELMGVANEVTKAHGVLAAAGCEGRFTGWVEQECHFSLRTAYRLIEINSCFGGFEHVSHIEDAALRKLASTSTPEEVVLAAKRAASSGTFVKLDWVKERLDKWTAESVEDDDEDEPDTIVDVEFDDEVDAGLLSDVDSLVSDCWVTSSPPICGDQLIRALRRAHGSNRRLRKVMLEVCGHKCSNCSVAEDECGHPLQLHHNTYERLGSEVASDLTILCHVCHPQADARRREVELSRKSVRNGK